MNNLRALLVPHRIVMMMLLAAFVLWCVLSMRWDWLPKYMPLAIEGIGNTLLLLAVSLVVGFLLAIPIGFAQAFGPFYLAWPARIFCTVIRGTPLLLQIWLIYYGLGSLFPQIEGIRDSVFWPYLRSAWPYAFVALTLSVAGYEGEVMRGALKGVNRGQLEAARAFGMPRFMLFRRVWLPLAIRDVLPTLGGEAVLQLKATPLVATITIVEIYSVASRVRQDTFIVYEPLLLLAVVYMIIAAILSVAFKFVENQVPSRR
ncbi:ABC transporter permease [Loktanella sp. D2R18]|uniref:ABC transporter permease n=1 Tax=Rhodobacterales TaxID=204455 RepID=UPI000DE849C6|nr:MULTISPECIES: ABC transporter permease subunit [Rhodobacterales]MDO6588624.1 ABC transporter permease subunit [Yoonia sp. 1_MG-2023]RBW42127.1 ABC transporter permease [Loktanella sp. D2R18]